MFESYTDEMLFALIQNSEEDAFTELYQRYWKKLYAAALKRMSSTADAQDIVQELFVKLWTRRSTLPDEVNVPEYLFAALRYRIINYLQADLVRLKYANGLLAEWNSINYALATEPNSTAELETVVQETVANMPARMREIFMLSYKNGSTPKEIAAQLSLSVQTVKNNLSSARSILRGTIANQDSELYAQLLLLSASLSIS